jgi:phosphoribosylamine--glycine ligase
VRVLLIGRWGKAHALAQAISKREDVRLTAVMDRVNPGIESVADEVEVLSLTDAEGLAELARSRKADFVVVSPEMTLKQGIRRILDEMGIPSFGPPARCTMLEADKVFARDLLRRRGLDVSPRYRAFDDPEEAVSYLRELAYPVAVKPAGVTEGDGVKVMGVQLKDYDEAADYVREVFARNIGGRPSVIIEEKISGEEFSLQAFLDGRHAVGMPLVRDYKLLEEGEGGSNTPGMGSYSMPDHLLPTVDRETYDQGLRVIEDAMAAMREEFGESYKGIITGQFMLTESGLRLVEFNVRAGDSEILNLQPLLQTDFMEICRAIEDQELDRIDIRFENKATVCKYVVPEGFPEPEGNVHLRVDEKAIEAAGCGFFYSCFKTGDGLYEPSPRLIAVTGIADTLKKAWERCEEGITHIHGEGLYHRRDIGTEELARRYA